MQFCEPKEWTMKSMETLEQGKQKLVEICDLLKKDTLEPAQKEAASIVDAAKTESQKIIDQANEQAKGILDEVGKKIEQERVLFNTSLDVASKQTFDKLREEVEDKLFHQELGHLVQQISHDPETVARLVNVIIEVIEREGLNGNISLGLAKSIKPEEISKFLIKEVSTKLSKKEIPVEAISGGAVVCLKDKQISVDISDESLKELLGSYLRSSFREILFRNV